ncbi:protein NUCLEAR FUSION DEFECTIVE 4-like [Cucurbita maxima]|uniref:Protein NUCLEAR FUSION DEFECTIVE 4-like n=1 Tax=Cucurbita maxima TaxID=3661 RepID=A0A6J1JP36_CUCMA|nr:protein NUCLEAR FUSION DEFECTIVE 4-like [Cucurbita maxima]
MSIFHPPPPPSSSAVKWLSLVSAVWVQSIAGNNYTFSNYSAALKSLMNLSQLQLNNLSVAKDLGKAFGLLSGLASDRLPTSLLLLIGSLEGLIGYGGQWLVVSKTINPLPYWQISIFMCMGGNSSTWMNTAVLVTCLRNFRRNIGSVSGVLKGYVALSTAIFTDLCFALFSNDPSSFLALLAVVPFAVCLIAILFLRETPFAVDNETEDSQYFWVLNAIAVAVAVSLLAFDLIPNPTSSVSIIFSIVLLILLVSPLVIPIHSFLKNRGRSGAAAEALLAAEEVAEVEGNGNPVIGEDHTIVEAMKTVEFWLLFVSFLFGVGTGLAVMNNMGQIGLALGYDDVSSFISLMSIWGFFGRILSGSASEYFIKKAGMARPLWNAASQILMAIGYILLAIGMPSSLYIGSIIVGICYGVRLAISVPIASEIFGLKDYGMIYNVLILNLPLGSFLFSGLLAGILYDMEATKIEEGGNTCMGAHCYRLVFVVMACSCVVGLGVDLLLFIKTKRLYSKTRDGR